MTTLNGWDVAAVAQAIDEVRRKPSAGKLTWRSRVTWDGGFGLDARAREIEQLGEVMERRFILRGDHPPELLGQNTGPTAIETLMAALGACMAGTFAAQATAREVYLEALEVDLSCVIDLNGFFGLRPVRPGVFDVDLAFKVQSDADPSTLHEIAEAAKKHSPVFDSVTRPVEVDVSVTRL